jgi:hypothetical protein
VKHSKQTGASVLGRVRKGNKKKKKKKKKDPNFPFSLVFWQRPSTEDLRVCLPHSSSHREKGGGGTEMKKISLLYYPLQQQQQL